MSSKFTLSICVLLIAFGTSKAQVKIGDNPNTINENSILELESSNKGLLVPRIAINDLNSTSPLSATIIAGMLVYSSGGTVENGFYNWNGTNWVKLLNSQDYLNAVAKTSTCTLLKTETFVLASNDIVLTLPAITSTDNGLAITVKNAGACTDLISVKGSGSATTDNVTSSTLTRWVGKTYVAYEGNWYVQDKAAKDDHIMEVFERGSWTTIEEAIAFLNKHMEAPMVIKLSAEVYNIASTITIDLPYPLTIQSTSFGSSTIQAAAGLAGKPMFRCLSESYFKMLVFDATTLTDYGKSAGEDCIRLAGSGTYHEIKDCTFDRFYNTVLDSSDAELWMFECDVSNAQNNGVLLHSPVAGAKLRISETDFMNCVKGINMEKGSNAEIQLSAGVYSNANASDVGINYVPATFSYSRMNITNNAWNNTGIFMQGFDFTTTRDANIFIESNAGMESKKPHCKINVLNNSSSTTVTTTGTWYKASFTNTSSSTCKFSVSNNKITYLSDNELDGVMVLTGNVICTNTNKVFSVAIVKNGNPAVRYGETTLKIQTAAYPFQWATNVYIPDMKKNDYFEIWISSSTDSDVYQLQDVQWFTNSQ